MSLHQHLELQSNTMVLTSGFLPVRICHSLLGQQEACLLLSAVYSGICATPPLFFLRLTILFKTKQNKTYECTGSSLRLTHFLLLWRVGGFSGYEAWLYSVGSVVPSRGLSGPVAGGILVP